MSTALIPWAIATLLLITLLIGVFRRRRTTRTRAAAAVATLTEEQVRIGSRPPGAFGHSFDPVAEIKQRIPDPPAGHMWELTVARNTEFCAVLTLGLLNIAEDKVTTSTSVNLTKTGMWEWARLYEANPTTTTARAFADIVAEPVDWAHAQVKRRKPPDDGVYHHEVIA